MPDRRKFAPRLTRFGAMVDEHLIRRGLSQSALARLVGVDPSYVNRIVKHGIERPSRPVVLEMAVAFDLDADETDRLLFAAGHAPERDWQTVAEAYAERLRQIDLALTGIA